MNLAYATTSAPIENSFLVMDFGNVTSDNYTARATHTLSTPANDQTSPRLPARTVGRNMIAGTLAALTSFLPSQTNASPHNVEVVAASAPAVLSWSNRWKGARVEMETYFGLPVGWDGPETFGPSQETLGHAMAFLAKLPLDLAEPQAGATGEGRAEWYWKSGNGLATVSFLDGRMSYYARVDGAVVRGSEVAKSLTIPQGLIDLLRVI